MSKVRRFKCIGLKETKVGIWNKYFNIGNTYILDEMLIGEGLEKISIKLFSNKIFKSSWWVDADQFEEIT